MPQCAGFSIKIIGKKRIKKRTIFPQTMKKWQPCHDHVCYLTINKCLVSSEITRWLNFMLRSYMTDLNDIRGEKYVCSVVWFKKIWTEFISNIFIEKLKYLENVLYVEFNNIILLLSLTPPLLLTCLPFSAILQIYYYSTLKKHLCNMCQN